MGRSARRGAQEPQKRLARLGVRTHDLSDVEVCGAPGIRAPRSPELLEAEERPVLAAVVARDDHLTARPGPLAERLPRIRVDAR
jgi:hypothetical protein